MTVETEYELADPTLFVDDPQYAIVGPLALTAAMQATHGMLLSQHKWPALTGQLPQSNNSSTSTSAGRPAVGGSTPSATPASGASALNGRRCFRCQGEHFVCDCHLPAPPGPSSGGTSETNAGPSDALP